MLKKLLKYDLKWCFKPLMVFYILAVSFSVAERIIASFEKTLILVLIDKICSGIVIAMIANILINCFMRNWARFIKNIYKDESYLTHTLPVSKNKIYLSKFLTSIITLLTSFAVIAACLAITFLNEASWMALKQSIEQSAILFDSSVFSFVAIFIIILFFQTMFMQISGTFGIIIGHKSNNLKIVLSVIIGYGTYMALSSLSVLVLFIAGLLNPEIMSVFNDMEVSANAVKSMMIVGIFGYAVYIAAIYFVGNKLLNKGVNID